MSVKDLLSKDSLWMAPQEDQPVVLSTRVRLARNLADRPFPHALTPEKMKQTEDLVAEVLQNIKLGDVGMEYVSFADVSPLERSVLVEKHLVSPALASLDMGRGVALSPDHKLAVMVNEEDHVRLQVLLPGNRLHEAFQIADDLDDALEEKLDIAYKEKFGYLTSCPTNVGIGMRVSTMMHLPALTLMNRMQQILGALAPLGLTVRGLYGEGSKAWANIYQISNQVTLGKSEEDTLASLEAITGQIFELECQAREVLGGENMPFIEDKVWRARGALQNARILAAEEAFRLLSEDRLGIEIGILPKQKVGFASLLINSLPAGLQYRENKSMTEQQSNIERARCMREIFSQANAME